MMKKQMALGMAAILCGAVVSSCIGISSISVSDLDPTANTVITSQAYGSGIMHLTAPAAADLEDKVVADLKAKGAIHNVRVRLQIKEYFGVYQAYEVFGQGEK